MKLAKKLREKYYFPFQTLHTRNKNKLKVGVEPVAVVEGVYAPVADTRSQRKVRLMQGALAQLPLPSRKWLWPAHRQRLRRTAWRMTLPEIKAAVIAGDTSGVDAAGDTNAVAVELTPITMGIQPDPLHQSRQNNFFPFS